MSVLILGDSIAVGTSWLIKGLVIAKIGMSSCWIAAHTPSQHFDLAIISAGVNDRPSVCTELIREKVHADRVIWLNPIGWKINAPAGAAKHGNRVVWFAGSPHPKSYSEIKY